MTKNILSSGPAKATHSAPDAHPIARMMAGFTGFAIVATLLLVTAIPVEADRGVCSTPIDTPAASCTAH